MVLSTSDTQLTVANQHEFGLASVTFEPAQRLDEQHLPFLLTQAANGQQARTAGMGATSGARKVWVDSTANHVDLRPVLAPAPAH